GEGHGLTDVEWLLRPVYLLPIATRPTWVFAEAEPPFRSFPVTKRFPKPRPRSDSGREGQRKRGSGRGGPHRQWGQERWRWGQLGDDWATANASENKEIVD